MIAYIAQGALVAHRQLAKEVEVGGQIPLAQAIFGYFHQKTVVAVLQPEVAVVLIIALPPASTHFGLVTTAAHRIDPACAVLDDGAEDMAHVRVEAVTGGELEGVLALQGIRGVVALQQVQRVIKEHAQVGAAFDIGQAQQGALGNTQ